MVGANTSIVTNETCVPLIVSTPDPSMPLKRTSTEAESQSLTSSQPASGTSLCDSNNADSTISPPPSDSVSPTVAENTSPEDNDKASHGSDNMSPTEDDKGEQCDWTDGRPSSVNMFKLSVENNYLFDLD